MSQDGCKADENMGEKQTGDRGNAMGSLAEKVPEVLPSFYYDLVARLVPGTAVVLLSTYLGLPGTDGLVKADLLSGVGILLLLGLGYLVALLLTPLGTLLGLLISRIANVSRNDKITLDELWTLVDSLQSTNPSAATTLSKMAAEVTLCENLLAGLLAILAVAGQHWPFVVSLVLVVLVSLCFRTVVLYSRARHLKA